MNVALNAQMVGEGVVAILGVEIADLGIDVELQQEWHRRVCGSFPDDHAISIAIRGFRCWRNRYRGLCWTCRRWRVLRVRVLSSDLSRCPAWFGFRRATVLSGGAAGDCPKAEAATNIIDVNVNRNPSPDESAASRHVKFLPKRSRMIGAEGLRRQAGDISPYRGEPSPGAKETPRRTNPSRFGRGAPPISRARRIGRAQPRLFPCTCCSSLWRFGPEQSRSRRS